MATFLVTLFLSIGVSPAPAAVRSSDTKGVWGPIGAEAARHIQLGQQLGARNYLTTLRWPDVSKVRPATARDPGDSAYAWPPAMDEAIALAASAGMRVTVNLTGAPAWASGSPLEIAPPTNPADFADFAAAASARYPQVTRWQIWSEPTKPANWAGLPRPILPNKPLTGDRRQAPQQYAAMLDATYAALHQLDPGDVVIGGNTWTAGAISPYQWIRAMQLPSGRPPRMDEYGHNPFSARSADLRDAPRVKGYADISDIDDLESWLDRWQRRPGRPRLRVYLSEFSIPSGSPSYEFNFFVPEGTQAKWTRAAMKLVRSHRRITGIAWVTPFDQTTSQGNITTGLVRTDGSHKPAFNVFAQG